MYNKFTKAYYSFSITKRTFHAITYRNAARYNAVKR